MEYATGSVPFAFMFQEGKTKTPYSLIWLSPTGFLCPHSVNSTVAGDPRAPQVQLLFLPASADALRGQADAPHIHTLLWKTKPFPFRSLQLHFTVKSGLGEIKWFFYLRIAVKVWDRKWKYKHFGQRVAANLSRRYGCLHGQLPDLRYRVQQGIRRSIQDYCEKWAGEN